MTARDVLERYRHGELTIEEAERQLRMDYVRRIGEHTLFDTCRSCRKDIPEIIYGQSKSPEQVAEIVKEVIKDKDRVLVSRASQEHYEAVCRAVGEAQVSYIGPATMLRIEREPMILSRGKIGILAAGTSDLRAAEEARTVAEAMGVEAMVARDVGIAAFHRFLDPLVTMLEAGADALVVVAGMEGALASVVSSLVDIPVIGVPTSVGYGVGGEGQAALVSMLQSCSPGLTVVNIDNGIGAGATAALISLRCRR
jgi:pyridinium-3,5-biscarboxylic acid mononucleotide synthase